MALWTEQGYESRMNAFQWMTVWIGLLVAAIAVIWFLTRERQH
jgi:hypothetical protein